LEARHDEQNSDPQDCAEGPLGRCLGCHIIVYFLNHTLAM
jgi:hypothetical protein